MVSQSSCWLRTVFRLSEDLHTTELKLSSGFPPHLPSDFHCSHLYSPAWEHLGNLPLPSCTPVWQVSAVCFSVFYLVAVSPFHSNPGFVPLSDQPTKSAPVVPHFCFSFSVKKIFSLSSVFLWVCAFGSPLGSFWCLLVFYVVFLFLPYILASLVFLCVVFSMRF